MRGACSLYSAWTMTCTSLRSGNASSGVRRMATMPATTAARVSRPTTRRLARAQSMILVVMLTPGRGSRLRLRRGLHAHARHVSHAAEGLVEIRFGVNQEGAGGDHHLARLQPVQHFDAIGDGLAHHDLAGHEATVGIAHEYQVALAGRQDTRPRDGEGPSRGRVSWRPA